jgi:leucyl/phenylalanyl-tRNA--protein transferase
MFGAESMFHRETDASKAAMAALVQHAASIGVELLDVQVLTDHTERMGAVEMPRAEYLRRLEEAAGRRVDWTVGVSG